MKKLIVALALMAMISGAAFAEFGVGAAAFLKSPVLAGQQLDTDNLNVNQISFGADARFKLGWFQAEGLLLYSTGEVDSLNAYLDAGIALDFAIFRFSLGAGPNFSNNFGKSYPIQAGINAKIGTDVKLGPVTVGLSYIMAMNIDNGLYVNTTSGLLGIQCLYWL
jgi:hypothetical protein